MKKQCTTNQEYWWKTQHETEKRDHLGRADIHGEDNIKTDSQETGCKDVGLTQNRDKWQLFVNTAMKTCVPKNTGNLLIR